MGHVLARRYLHPTRYRSSYKELKDWLADYADHPQAKQIYNSRCVADRPTGSIQEARSQGGRRHHSGKAAAPPAYRSTKRLTKSAAPPRPVSRSVVVGQSDSKSPSQGLDLAAKSNLESA